MRHPFLGFFPGLFTFQTKCDDPNASEDLKARLTQVLHGPLEQHAAKLAVLNELGAGIYFSVNETDGQGRRLENITKLRALVCEWDTDHRGKWALPPSLMVESSPGKLQAYWLLAPPLEASAANISRWKALEHTMVTTMGGDPGAKLVTQVLRVPGYTNNKYPTRPLVRWLGPTRDVPYYTLEQLEAAWPPTEGTGGIYDSQTVNLPTLYRLPDEATRLRRFGAWLAAQQPPRAGEGARNPWYYSRVKAAVNDFAIDDADALAELLADHSFRYHEKAAYNEEDFRRLIRNARRSSNGRPRGCKYFTTPIVPTLGGE